MVIWSNPLLKQGHPEQAAQDVVQMAFEDLQKARDSTTSLGNPCQCSVTLTVKKCFLVFTGNLLCWFVPVVSHPGTGTIEKSLVLSSLHPSFRYL